MGLAAYDFADLLHAAGQRYWQMLPLGPTSYGDSPYQSFSSYAGNPYLIDLDLLIEDGLLTEQEVCDRNWSEDPRHVDYGKLYENRLDLLKRRRNEAGCGIAARWRALRRKTPPGCRTTPCSWPSSGISA